MRAKSKEKAEPGTRCASRLSLAEMERFELAPGNARPTAFRVRTLQPLGYISKKSIGMQTHFIRKATIIFGSPCFLI